MQSIREPIASFFYDKKYTISYQQHAVERIRQLFAQALSYPLSKEKGDYGIARHFISADSIEPYVIFFIPRQEMKSIGQNMNGEI